MASRIVTVQAIPLRFSRNLDGAVGTAGTPNQLSGEGIYRWSRDYPALYSTCLESALVKLTLENGVTGWGEAQAPLAPEVACTIVQRLLRPVLEGQEFDGSPAGIAALWERMYSTMRVRGQTGGFMLDAISGVDLALWDAAGKMAGRPVSAMIAGSGAKQPVPAYISGLGGDRLKTASQHYAAGFRIFKLYYESCWQSVLDMMDQLRVNLPGAQVAVDALWHLDPGQALEQAAELDRRNALWLECPLMPEEPEAHAALAAAIATPLALGESYRTVYELAPFFRMRAMRYVQPDLGRSGITGALRIADAATRHGMSVVPHVSIAFGPQIAAAIHFAAAAPNCELCEYNPAVLHSANRFLRQPLRIENAAYVTPDGPGLGIEIDEENLSTQSTY